MTETTVAPHLVGDVWPIAHPGEDPVLYGHVRLTPGGAFQARSLQTFRLVYTVGRYGIDDTGGIHVVFRFVGDHGMLQTEDPAAPDMSPPTPATARASRSATTTPAISGPGSRR